MNYLALVSVAIKYVPVVISWVQANEAAIQEFVKEVEAALGTAAPAALTQPAPTQFMSK